MKRIWAFFLSLLLAAGVLSCSGSRSASGSIPNRPDKLGLEEVKFTLPKTERFELANGLVV